MIYNFWLICHRTASVSDSSRIVGGGVWTRLERARARLGHGQEMVVTGVYMTVFMTYSGPNVLANI